MLHQPATERRLADVNQHGNIHQHEYQMQICFCGNRELKHMLFCIRCRSEVYNGSAHKKQNCKQFLLQLASISAGDSLHLLGRWFETRLVHQLLGCRLRLIAKVSLQPLGDLFEFGCELFVLLFLVCVASVRRSSIRILRLLHGPLFHKEQHGCSFAARGIVPQIGHTAESQRESNLKGIVVKRKLTCFVKVP